MADSQPSPCAVAFEEGIARIMEKCKDEDDDSELEFTKRMLGIDQEPDPDCEQALSDGLDAATCESQRGTAQWVFCRTHNAPDAESQSLVEMNDGDLGAAVAQAWAMADERCPGEA